MFIYSGCKRGTKGNSGKVVGVSKAVTPSAVHQGSKYISPDSPLVIAIDGFESILTRLKYIAEHLVKGTMGEMFFQQWVSQLGSSKVTTAVQEAGVSLAKRFEFWISADAEFVDILLPVANQTKLRAGLSSLIDLIGPEGVKNAADPSKREVLVADEANKKESGDMFWHLSTDAAVSRIGCHYYDEGYERCSMAVSGNGVSDAAFQTWWKKSYSQDDSATSPASGKSMRGFSRSISSGFQMRFNVEDEAVRKKVIAALEKSASSKSELDMLRKVLKEGASGEYWVDLEKNAIHYGSHSPNKKSDSNVSVTKDSASLALTKSLAGRLPNTPMIRFLGLFPQRDAIERWIARSADSSVGSASAKVLSDDLSQDLSMLLKAGGPLAEALFGRPFAGFMNLNPDGLASLSKDNFDLSHVGDAMPIGFVANIPKTLSDADLEKSLQSLVKAGNIEAKKNQRKIAQRVGKLKAAAKGKRDKRVKSSSISFALTPLKKEDRPASVQASWVLNMDKTELGRFYRKDDRLIFSFGKRIADFLVGEKVEKEDKAGESLVSIPAADASKWVANCAGATQTDGMCTGLIELNRISVIAEMMKASGTPQVMAIASQLDIALKRIKKIEFGMSGSEKFNNGVGQILFAFEE